MSTALLVAAWLVLGFLFYLVCDRMNGQWRWEMEPRPLFMAFCLLVGWVFLALLLVYMIVLGPLVFLAEKLGRGNEPEAHE